MTLIKTSLLNAIAVASKMLALLGINKVLAIYVGPVGYPIVGQFQNFVQIITTFASGAINNGVIKYTAEYKDDDDQLSCLWTTAAYISVIGAAIFGVVIIISNNWLSLFFLKDLKYAGVFNWFGVGLIFFVLNSLLLAILNGKKEVRRYVLANILGSGLSIAAIYYMTTRAGLYGALIALGTYQSVAFFATLFIFIRSEKIRKAHFAGAFSNEVVRNLSKFAAMALVSAACVPLSHMFVRDSLISSLGSKEAGYWEGMSRLSAAYLMLITSTLSVYFLPRFSEIGKWSEIRRELIGGYKLIIPVVLALTCFIYLFRSQIIVLLFSEEFIPMQSLFVWQLLGDIFKICGWLLAYLILSKAMVQFFVWTEIIFSFSFFLLVNFFIKYFGVDGAAIAHLVNYAIYFFVLSFYINKKIEVGVNNE